MAMSLEMAVEMKTNWGLKATRAAAATATAGRSGTVTRASAQVAAMARRPHRIPLKPTRRAARTVPRQGQASRAPWTMRFRLSPSPVTPTLAWGL